MLLVDYIYEKMTEKLHSIVSSYPVGPRDSVVVSVPKEVREVLDLPSRAKFTVKTDKEGRIIYEEIERGAR